MSALFGGPASRERRRERGNPLALACAIALSRRLSLLAQAVGESLYTELGVLGPRERSSPSSLAEGERERGREEEREIGRTTEAALIRFAFRGGACDDRVWEEPRNDVGTIALVLTGNEFR